MFVFAFSSHRHRCLLLSAAFTLSLLFFCKQGETTEASSISLPKNIPANNSSIMRISIFHTSYPATIGVKSSVDITVLGDNRNSLTDKKISVSIIKNISGEIKND